jgi:hypothetical protein
MQKRPTGGEALRPQARTIDLVVSQLPDEELIYDLKTHQAFCLNKTAAAVWNHCDGETTASEIARVLSAELDTTVNEEWGWLALQQLHRHSLLEPGIIWPEKMSRRMILRKLGTSALAIPMVMAIVAPAAAQAATCGDPDNDNFQNADGCPCNGFDDCVSHCCGFSPAPGHICVTPGTVSSGSPCRAGCECTSGTCSGSPLTCT